MRGLRQPKAAAYRKETTDEPLKMLRTLLDDKGCPAAEPIISWDGEGLAALDLDYHANFVPEHAEYGMHHVPWEPDLYWRTHGGGLRCIFASDQALAAEEKAAAYAALFISGRRRRRTEYVIGLTGVEIKRDTRHPGYAKSDGSQAGSVHVGYGCVDLSALMKPETADVDEAAIEAWLEEEGLEQGKSYEHDRCPINPDASSHAKPVWVGDYGIFCQSCAAKEGNGLRTWGRLIDGGPAKPNRLAAMVRGRCHWNHAKHVLADLWPRMNEKLCRLAYTALLKGYHVQGEHAEAKARLVEKVFFPAIEIVRGVGQWVEASDLATPIPDKALTAILPCLPAAQFVNDTGEVGTSRLQLGNFQRCADPAEYPPLQPLIGCDLRPDFTVFAEQPDDVVRVAVPAKRAPFRYLQPEERKAIDVNKRLVGQFPGVNVNLLRLLIAAKAFQQASPCEPCMIAITGQSAAGKSASVRLAAELAFDSVEPSHMPDRIEEFFRSVGSACGRRGFFLVDEIAKSQVKPTELEAGLLGLKRGAQFRALYRGHVSMGALPVIVLADTLLPDVLREPQLARRVVHVPLGAGGVGTDWRITCDGGEIEGWRSVVSERNRDVANTIVLEVIDAIADCRTFHEAAAKFGFTTISEAGRSCGDVDPDADLLALYHKACETQTEPDAYFKHPSWRVFDPQNHGCKLARAWRTCIDGSSAQRVTGADWGRILGRHGAEVEYRTHGRKVALRFRVGDPRSPDAIYNADVRPAALPLPESRQGRDRVTTGVMTTLSA
jgi:hypothetical protein